LTNQQFKIKMTGRDSLDCHSSNTVYDSVMVSHTETPPSSLRLCNATVGDDDASIQLSWEADVENDVVGFKVYRRRDGERVFTVHDSIFNLTDRTYIDIHNVQPDSHSYCFRMTVMDRCGNESPMSDEICTILLHASQKGYTSLLNWTKFVRWGTDPLQYNLWKGSPIPDGFPPAFLQSVDPHVLSFVDLVVNKAWLCYRIIAIPDGGGCAEPSQSNEACVIFSPTLYMPTAFTPNGDGLNDYFSAVGEFVETSSLEIYDRWGKLLFRSTNLNEGWDGSVDGQPAPEGGYVYKVKIVGYNGDTFAKEGSITLVR
jgi:gliding motility-associated-like protein